MTDVAELVLAYTGGDTTAVSLFRSLRFFTGERVILNLDDAEMILTYMMAQEDDERIVLHAENGTARMDDWSAHLNLRLRYCATIDELMATDPCNKASLIKNIMRVKETLWPVDQAIYSTERCATCKQKTVYYVSPQVRSSDEEQAFFAVCTRCNNT